MRFLRKLGIVSLWMLIFASAFVVLYLAVIRPWHRTWGTSGVERSRPMPGDGIVEAPNYGSTRAITIDAPPDRVWPWLVQMGYRRGGLYSYDWIDRALKILDRPSATRILPKFQDLKAGMEVPIGRGQNWPVSALVPGTSLILDIRGPGTHIVWSWLLSALPDDKTRLLLRIRGQMKIAPALSPIFVLLDPGEFAMIRKMLTGIRRRVEGRPPSPPGELIELAGWAAAILIGLAALAGAFLRKRWRQPFATAWAAFAVVFFLALRQPALGVGPVLDVLLLAAFIISLRRRHRSG